MGKIHLVNDARQNNLEHEFKFVKNLINGLIKTNINDRISINSCIDIISEFNE